MLNSDELSRRFDPLDLRHDTHRDAEVFAQDIGGSAETITVPDAELLFQGHFHKRGFDLVIENDAQRFTVHDYFRAGTRATLRSPEGATIGGDIASALAVSDDGERYAQAGPPTAAPAIGRVETVTGQATAIRNGTVVVLNQGDVVLKGDTVQTDRGSALGITFLDGSSFNLAGNARMVLNEMIYQAGGTQNSALLSIVQGSVSFLAGQVAKTGDMKVGTPVATMGIRGTLVTADVDANNGTTKFTVVQEQNGQTGRYDLLAPDGRVIATISQAGDVTTVTPTGQVSTQPQTASERAAEQAAVAAVYTVFASAAQNPFTPPAAAPPGPQNGPQGGNGGGSSTAPDLGAQPPPSAPPPLAQLLGTGQTTVLVAASSPPPASPPVIQTTQTAAPPIVVETQATPQTLKGDYGTLLVAVDGTRTYVPNAAAVALPEGVTRQDTFTVSDGRGGTTPVTYTVTGENDAPSAGPAITKAVVASGSTPQTGNLLTAATDPDTGETAQLKVAAANAGTTPQTGADAAVPSSGADKTIVGTYGTLTVHADGSYSYVPDLAKSLAQDQHGTDTFAFTVADPHAATASTTISFDVTGINDAPVAGVLPALALNRGDTAVTQDLRAGTTDPDNGETATLIVANVTYAVDSGTSTATAPDGLRLSGSTLTIDPTDAAFVQLARGQYETVVVSYDVVDVHGASVHQTDTVTITGTNHVPVTAQPLADAAGQGAQPVTRDLLSGASDRDGDTLAISGLTYTVDNGAPTSVAPSGISLSGSTLTVDPGNPAFTHLGAGEHETIVVSYAITDGFGGSVAQTETVTVTGTNDSPTSGAALSASATQGDAAISQNLLAGSSDPDTTDTLVVTNVSYSVDNGSATAAAPAGFALNGATLSVDPSNAAFTHLAQGSQQTVAVAYDISDGHGGTVHQTDTVTIAGRNDAPVVPQTELVANGGFETGDFTGWTLSGQLDHESVGSNAHSGADAASFGQVGGFGSLSQTLTTVAGEHYTLGFWLQNEGGPTNGFDVSWGGQVLTTLSDQSPFGYTHYTFDVTASAASTTLTFDFRQDPSYFDLDDVSVSGSAGHHATLTRTDAPSTYALLAGASDPDDGETATLSIGNVTYAVDGGEGSGSAPTGVALTGSTLAVSPGQTTFANLVVSYDIQDVHGATTHQTETITIGAVNHAPTAPAAQAVSTTEDHATATTAIGASDVDGDTLTYSVLNGSGPAFGAVMFGSGTFTYTPNANANGTDHFTILVDDGHGGTAQQAVTVNVAAVNDAPTAPATQTASTTEDHATATTAIGANDVDSDALTYSVLNGSGPAFGAVSFGSGTFTYTPNANANGTDRFTIVVDDGHGGTAQQAVTINVAAVNDAPAFGGDEAFTVLQGGTYTLTRADLAAVDPDNTDAQLAYTVAPTRGFFTAGGSAAVTTFTQQQVDDGQVVYHHGGSGTANDSFTIGLSDGVANTTSTFNVSVTAVNHAPTVSGPVSGSGNEGAAPFTVNLLQTASDQDGDTLHAQNLVWSDTGSSTSLPGGFTRSGDTLVVDPSSPAYDSLAAGQSNTSHFTYDVVDPSGALVHESATITIQGTNDAPTAPATQTVSTTEDHATSPTAIGASDVDGDTLTYSVLNGPGPAFGAVSFGSGTFTYTPNANANGTDHFTIVVNDGHGGTAQQAVTVNVAAVNDAPTFGGNRFFTVSEGGVYTLTRDDLAAIDPDNTDEQLTYTVAPAHGFFTVTTTSGSVTTFTQRQVDDGQVQYVNDGANASSDSIAIGLSDGVLSTSSTLDVSVTAVDYAPSGQSETYGVDENDSISATLAGNDRDGDRLTYSLDAPNGREDDGRVITAHGHATVNVSTGQFTYMPTDGYFGEDTFQYRVFDGNSYSSASTITIEVAHTQGTAAADDLVGTAFANSFHGYAGNDTLTGLAGNDMLDGGDGIDLARYDAASGAITVNMAAGTVVGGDSTGSDTLVSIERVRGTNYADRYDATRFVTTGYDAPGTAATFNEFEGGGGDDTITGNGNTRISYQHAAAAVTVDLALGTAHGTATGDVAGVGTDTITGGVIQVRGSDFDDTLTGSNNYVPSSSETFEGLAGNDFIDGKGGYDKAIYNNVDTGATGIIVDLAAGTVTGRDAAATAVVGTDTLRGIEGISGTNASDIYKATGFSATSTNGGADQGSFNEFEGYGGDDAITGNGNTRVSYQHAAAGVTVNIATGQGGGTDPGDAAAVGHDTFTGVNAVRGSDYADHLIGSGTNGNNTETFEGRGGDDIIDGGSGFDRARYDVQDTGANGIIANMAAGTVTGRDAAATAVIGLDHLISIESIVGSYAADILDGTGYTATTSLSAGQTINDQGNFLEFEGMGGNDLLIGNGDTRASFSRAAAAVTADLAQTTVLNGVTYTGVSDSSAPNDAANVGHDLLKGVIALRGSAYNDTLSGSNNAAGTTEYFEGRAGDDRIDGRGGFDIASYFFDSVGTLGIAVNMAAGTVSYRGTSATTDPIGHDTLINIEGIRGTTGNDVYDATGFTGASTDTGLASTFNQFQGYAGDDDITGNGNTTLLYSEATAGVTVNLQAGTASGTGAGIGTDTIHGGIAVVVGSNYDDTFYGTSANEVFNGGAGTDRVRYDTVTMSGLGINVQLAAGTVTGRDAAATSMIGTDTLRGIEGVTGTNAADAFNATGFTASSTNGGLDQGTFNEFEGFGGDDTVVGNGNTRISYRNASAGVTVNIATGSGAGTDAGDAAGVGHDTFTGVNAIRGSSYADHLIGSANGGDTEMFEGRGGDDIIDGGSGLDRARYDGQATGATGIIANMAAGTVTGRDAASTAVVGLDHLISVESIVGSASDDIFDGTGYTAFTNLSSGQVINDRGDFLEFEGVGGNDILIGNGDTRASYSRATAAVTVDLAQTTVVDNVTYTGVANSSASGDPAGVGHDLLKGINAIRGSSYNDTLLGSNNTVGTTETLEGRAGNDILDGRGGFDVALYLNDTVGTLGIAVNMAAGTVSYRDTSATTDPIGHDTLINIEGIRGTTGNDVYDATGFTGASTDTGLASTFNQFQGYAGDDDITGNGNTTLIYSDAAAGVTVNLQTGIASGTGAGIGTDTIHGGIATVIGSNYDDAFYGTSANEVFNGGSAGFDRVRYDNVTMSGLGINVQLAAGTVTGRDAAATSLIGTDTLRSIETLTGTNAADVFNAVGFTATSTNSGLEQGTGNDFEGYGGDDTLIGNGNTRVSYRHAAAGVTVDLGAGTGQSSGTGDAAGVGHDTFSGVNSVRGSNFDDTLYGSDTTAYTEFFEGLGGNDIIDGRGGIDVVRYDLVTTGTVGVQINMAAGTVTSSDSATFANVGNDTLRHVEGVYGTSAADTYNAVGFSGTSTNAGSSNDYNQFQGFGGNDDITGNGNTYVGYFAALAGVTVDLAAGTAHGTASGDVAGIGTDTFHGGVVGVNGSNFADLIYGSDSAGAEYLFGGGGNDIINGRGGTNYLVGGAGNDTIIGGSGTDIAGFSGLQSNYTITNNGGGSFTVAGGPDGTDTLTGIEILTFTGTGSGGAYYMYADADVSSIYLNGSDPIYGTSGNDHLTVSNGISSHLVDLGAGTADRVTLSPVAGGTTYASLNLANTEFLDTLGSGNEFVTLQSLQNGLSVDLGAGTDTLTLFSPSDSGTYTNVVSVAHVETVNGGSANDTVNFNGDGSTNQTLGLVSGTDTVNFGGTSPTFNISVYGSSVTVNGRAIADDVTLNNNTYGVTYDLGAGSDTLRLHTDASPNHYGNTVTVKNVETVIGGDYTDVITIADTSTAATTVVTAGLGQDFVTAGAGSDTFRSTSLADSAVGATRDTVTNFDAAHDTFEFDFSGFTTQIHFVGSGAFTGTTATHGGAQARLDTSNILHIDVNGDGVIDATHDMEIQLNNLHGTLTDSNFHVGHLG